MIPCSSFSVFKNTKGATGAALIYHHKHRHPNVPVALVPRTPTRLQGPAIFHRFMENSGVSWGPPPE